MPESQVRDTFEQVSPIKIEPSATSIKVGLSRRFLLFQLLRWLKRKMEDDPHLNFISIVKTYKALGNILDGTLYELHRDRDHIYFKTFFIDETLWKIVKEELEWVYKRTDDPESVSVTITKRGVIVYDNYKEGEFNTLLLTMHSGTWMRSDIQEKQALTKKDRLLEEDIDTHKLYANLVLEKGGVWMNNKASRFACDYNRSREKAIYSNQQEEWLDKVWKEPLDADQRKWLLEGWDEFYHILQSIIKTHYFNILFDGHSMSDSPDRPAISFGTQYIPSFYMPIVRSMQQKLTKIVRGQVLLDKPYYGGNIPKWLNEQFPNRFIFSMEINKRLYMTRDRKQVVQKKCDTLSRNITKIFDIE